MAETVNLDDNILEAAGAYLVQASSMMTSGNVRRPSGDLASITGIGSAVTLYLKGLNVARAALADGARTGSETVSSIMSESTELDQYIAQTLGAGFAVEGGPV